MKEDQSHGVAAIDSESLFVPNAGFSEINYAEETLFNRLLQQPNGQTQLERLTIRVKGSKTIEEWNPVPNTRPEHAPNTIHKFAIPNVGANEIHMPAAALILSVQVQNGELVLWALVNPEEKKVARIIEAHPTGEVVREPNNLIFLTTVQVAASTLVFHIFERTIPLTR